MYCSGSNGYNYLLHLEYRHLKRAKYGFAHVMLVNMDEETLSVKNPTFFENTNLISNGEDGIKIPKQYLD